MINRSLTQELRSLLSSISALAMIVPLIVVLGCKEAAETPRILKKKVELGKIASQNFTLPGGAVFNFAYVVNAQAYELLANSEYFILPFAPTTFSTLSSSDQSLLSDASVLSAEIMAKGNPPACVQDYPNMKIGGSINSFEFTSGIGVKFGYNQNGDHKGVSGEARVKVDISELDMSLNGYDPLTLILLGSGVAKPNETKTGIGVDIDFAEYSVGPEFFFKSPLSGVTRKGLNTSLKTLNDVTSKYPWFAQIIEDQDAYVVFNAGSRSGIRVGDKFDVHNLEHFWQGTPCLTPYLGNVPVHQAPELVVEVYAVGDDLAKAKVLQRTPGESAYRGSRVSINTLVPNVPAK